MASANTPSTNWTYIPMVDKNSIFGGMLTTQGAAKKTNCDALGIPWEPRYMLIGDANGTDPVPSASQTKLVNQVYRAQLNQLRVSPTDSNVLIAELVLPPDVGGWWIRELALEDKDGVFCAVANAAPSYKPLLAQGSGRNQVVRMHIITSGTSNIQLKIDPSVVLATRGYVDELINGLLPANKTAGTFTKVTVNDRGVFVSGSNPTTLAGFGIKDTFTKTEIESMISQASEMKLGTAKIATQVQTEGGTDDATIVTPKKLRLGFLASLTPNGYVAFPSWLGGFTIQWGQGSYADKTPISFTLAYANACFVVLVTDGTVVTAAASDVVQYGAAPDTLSKTGFLLRSSLGVVGGNVFWLSVGK